MANDKPDSAAVTHAELTATGFSALLGAAADGIVIIDKVGNILNFNAAAEKIFGYSAEEVHGENVKMLMPDPYHSEHDDYIRHYNEGGEARIIGIGRRVEAMRKDSTVFPIELSVGEYREPSGQYFIGIIRDLSERERAERELQRSRDQSMALERQLAHVDRINIMGEMASGIAHEINQPLTAISSYVRACTRRIESGGISASKINELLEKIDQQSLRAGEIVQRIRSMIRPHDRLRERFVFDLLIKEALELAGAGIRSRGISLYTKLEADKQEVIADGIQIQQVVLNLIGNAMDATEASGAQNQSVELGTRFDEPAGEVVCWVRDHGAGVDKDMTDKIFDSFVTTKSKGTGMGLSISRSIVTNHGGRIWCEAASPGTTFYFSLPIAVLDEYADD